MSIVTKAGTLCLRHVEELRASGLSDKQIALTGYWTDEKGQLCITYYNSDGSLCLRSDGKQWYRHKPVYDKPAASGEKRPKYLSPKDEGCRLYHSRLAIEDGNYIGKLADTSIPLFITEGEKKTDCGVAHQYLVVGLGGVSSWVDNRSGGDESRPIPELASIPMQNRTVVLCFDSDFRKPQVWAELVKLSIWLTAMGAHVMIMRLPCTPDEKKLGLDDLIVLYGADAFERLYQMAEPAMRTLPNGSVVFGFKAEPIESSSKAEICWMLMRDEWAVREGYGLYQRQGNYWKVFSTKPGSGIDADLYRLMAAQGWVKRSKSVTESVKAELLARLTVREHHWRPYNLLCFRNGVYDVETETFSQQPPEGVYIINQLDYDWVEDATCERWQRFLFEATQGDMELMALIQAVFRYVITPKDRSKPSDMEKAFCFVGRKGTGKGTLIETLMALVGHENVGNASPQTFTDASTLCALLDCTVGVDMDSSGHLPNPGLFNSVVSNEPVLVNQKYQPMLKNHRLGVTIVWGANDVITVGRAGAEGMDRRLVYIPMNYRPPIPDTGLKGALQRELGGIMRWALSLHYETAREIILYSGHLKSVAEASVDSALHRHPVYAFLSEKFPDGHPGIGAAEFYETYKDWCKATNNQPLKSGNFRKEMQKLEQFQPGMFAKLPRTSSGNYYRVGAWNDFDLVGYLGIAPKFPVIVPPAADPNCEPEQKVIDIRQYLPDQQP